MRRVIGRLFAIVSLAGAALSSIVALPACTLTEGTPAADAPLPKTGNAKYDDFFSAVVEVRDQARRAPSDADAGHADLVKALGSDPKAQASPVDAVGERAKKLQDKGVLLHLEIAPAPKVVALRGKVAVGADGEALFKAMEAALQSSLDTRKRLAALAGRAQELEKRRAELRDQIADTFKDEPPARRDDITTELDRVKDILANAGDSASRAAGAESRFVVDLVYAAETGGGSRPEASTQPPGRGARRGGGQRASSSPSGAGAGASPPPPKKKPKGDDFEP